MHPICACWVDWDSYAHPKALEGRTMILLCMADFMKLMWGIPFSRDASLFFPLKSRETPVRHLLILIKWLHISFCCYILTWLWLFIADYGSPLNFLFPWLFNINSLTETKYTFAIPLHTFSMLHYQRFSLKAFFNNCGLYARKEGKNSFCFSSIETFWP